MKRNFTVEDFEIYLKFIFGVATMIKAHFLSPPTSDSMKTLKIFAKKQTFASDESDESTCKRTDENADKSTVYNLNILNSVKLFKLDIE